MAATAASNQAARFGAGEAAVSVLRGVVLGNRIDAEFLSSLHEPCAAEAGRCIAYLPSACAICPTSLAQGMSMAP